MRRLFEPPPKCYTRESKTNGQNKIFFLCLQAKNMYNDETFSSFLFIYLARLFVPTPWMMMPSKLMQNWVFMIGPMLGGALAGIFFNVQFFGFCELKEKKCENHDDEEKQDLKSN